MKYMKALSLVPSQLVLNILLTSRRKEEPVLIPEAPENCARAVEIKRFIRNLRKCRQINFTRDFIY
jgi:hypothetical protein